MSGDHLLSNDPTVGRKSAALPDGERRSTKGAKVDDVASTITGDLLMILHKNFHILNDVVETVLKRSDRASLPPPRYLTVRETGLRARLRFPPPAELVQILKRCGVYLSQAILETVGLIALFIDRGAVLTPEHLSWMGRLTSDMQGRIYAPGILRRAGPVSTFFVRYDWGLLEKWGKMRDLRAPLHVREEDIMRLLKVPDVEHLLYEVCYLNKYIEEEFLFKVGLSFHPGRSDARMLKPTSKVPEPPVPVPKAASKRQVGGEDPQVLLKKKFEGAAVNTCKVAPVSSPVKIRVHGDILNHQCVGRRKADDLCFSSVYSGMASNPLFSLISVVTAYRARGRANGALNEWNAEFVQIKYLKGEYKRKYDQKTREAKVLEEELCGCRTELANINQQIDHLQVDLERAQATIIQLREDHRAFGEKVAVLEAENKRSQTLIAEKEAALTSFVSSRVIEDFKKSIAYKIIIQDHIRVEVEGLTPSQASDDFPPGSDGDEIESELQKAFALEADDEVVDIE
ncbi:hypothetical protein IEQ34_010525 [Dendrobium chrysotoxum]|uniref:Uncharacterized protein n=1 Tax=Dendrobium chrysotoxum TaxID=161865 RepID=A0AAV7GV13_DENCH|nr:hypothetical protein IEQ34_010525 [Dendrobium chrysotoxum]